MIRSILLSFFSSAYNRALVVAIALVIMIVVIVMNYIKRR